RDNLAKDQNRWTFLHYVHGGSRMKSNSRFKDFWQSSLSGFRLLGVRSATIKRRDDDKQNGSDQKNLGEKVKIGRSLKADSAVGILDGVIDHGGEDVAERNRAEISAHGQGLELGRGLGVGEFQMRDRDHDFSGA